MIRGDCSSFLPDIPGEWMFVAGYGSGGHKKSFLQ